MAKVKHPGCEKCEAHRAAIEDVRQYCRASMVDPDKPAQGFEALLRTFLQAVLEIIARHVGKD